MRGFHRMAGLHRRMLRGTKNTVSDKDVALLSDLFLTKLDVENSANALEIFGTKPAVIDVNVPASSLSRLYRKASDHSRMMVVDVVIWVLKLHLAGYTLKGDVFGQSFRYTWLGSLKMVADKLNCLRKMNACNSKKYIDLDMQATADLIEYGIFSGFVMPVDFVHFVGLLRMYKKSDKELILNHPALKEDNDVLNLFEILYYRFKDLHTSDVVKYRRVVAAMPYCDIDANHWKIQCEENYFLQLVLAHQFLKNKKTQFRVGRVSSGRGGRGGRGRAGRGGRGGRGRSGRGGRGGRGGGGSGLLAAPAGVPSTSKKRKNTTSHATLGATKRLKSNTGAQVPVTLTPEQQIMTLGPQYTKDGSGMLKLIRNGKQHASDYRSIINFSLRYFDLLHIFGSVLPGIFSHFIKAMNDVKELKGVVRQSKLMCELTMKYRHKLVGRPGRIAA